MTEWTDEDRPGKWRVGFISDLGNGRPSYKYFDTEEECIDLIFQEDQGWASWTVDQ